MQCRACRSSAKLENTRRLWEPGEAGPRKHVTPLEVQQALIHRQKGQPLPNGVGEVGEGERVQRLPRTMHKPTDVMAQDGGV